MASDESTAQSLGDNPQTPARHRPVSGRIEQACTDLGVLYELTRELDTPDQGDSDGMADYVRRSQYFFDRLRDHHDELYDAIYGSDVDESDAPEFPAAASDEGNTPAAGRQRHDWD